MEVALIVVIVIVALLSVGLSFYLLGVYQHPDDYNQSWFPKVVVLVGICLAIWTVLLFPLDVANSADCPVDQPLSNCDTTLPMHALWYACYIAIVVVVFAITPFALFYYEADSEWSTWRKILSGCLWAIGTFAFLILVSAVPWAFAGYAIYPVEAAISGILPVSYLSTSQALLDVSCVGVLASFNSGSPNGPPAVNTTIAFLGSSCDTSLNGLSEDWSVKVSYIMYLMAILATIGWFLFMVFGGIGIVALPLDPIRGFLGRPRSCITRAAYMERARDLGRRAAEIKGMAETLRREERSGGRAWRWRKHAKALDMQLLILEEDEEELTRVYPRGEDPEYNWTLTVMGFYGWLLVGLICLGLTITWILQVILYVLISPPASPMLNTMFEKAGDVFPLFGVLLFGLWVFYLQAAVLRGAFKFGLNFLVLRIHPMKKGATILSSFLFNVALVLLATTATIQFAASAFALYAESSTVLDVFGNQITSLQGLGWLYSHNVFIYIWFGFIGITLIYLCVRGPDRWKRRKPEDAYVF